MGCRCEVEEEEERLIWILYVKEELEYSCKVKYFVKDSSPWLGHFSVSRGCVQ